MEFGTTSKLLNDRLSIDLTLFSTQASDLIFTVPAPAGSVPPVKNLNAKKVSNKGIEFSTRLSIGALDLNSNTTEGQNSMPDATTGSTGSEKASPVLKVDDHRVFASAQISVNYMFLQQDKTPLPYSPKHKLSVQLQSSVKKLIMNLE